MVVDLLFNWVQTMKSFLQFFKKSAEPFARFLADRSGNTATMFAVAAIPLLGATGAAIDYSNISRAKSELQAALDSAVLAAVVANPKTADAAQLAVSRFVEANRGKLVVAPPVVRVTLEPGGGLSAFAGVDVQNTFMKVMGQPSTSITVHSQAATGSSGASPVEIVLVMDTTDSMSFPPASGGAVKIDSAKAAASQLIDLLAASDGGKGNIKIGLVPFAAYVNVGKIYKGAPWLTGTADVIENHAAKCEDEYPNAVYGPPVTTTATCKKDGVSYSCTKTDKPLISKGAAVNVCKPAHTSTSSWEGCVGSRKYPLDTQEGADAVNPAVGIDEECSDPIIRLTTNYALIKSKVSSLSTDDETYIAPGLIWGWNILSPSGPFADGAAYGSATRKVVVLLTDGANTLSPDYPTHEGEDPIVANARTAEVCVNIKARKIEIYAIAFDVTDPTIQNILSSCASSPPNYFNASSNAAMAEAFKKIGTVLTSGEVRLTR